MCFELSSHCSEEEDEEEMETAVPTVSLKSEGEEGETKEAIWTLLTVDVQEMKEADRTTDTTAPDSPKRVFVHDAAIDVKALPMSMRTHAHKASSSPNASPQKKTTSLGSLLAAIFSCTRFDLSDVGVNR